MTQGLHQPLDQPADRGRDLHVAGLNRGAAKLKRGVIDRRRDGGGIVEAFDGDAFFSTLTSTTAPGATALMALVTAFGQPLQVMPETW
jgi:hypothetical protein